MENNKTKGLLTAMLTVSIFFGGWMVIKNKSAKNEAEKERSVLLTEKDMLTKEAKLLAIDNQKFANLSVDRKKKIDELLLNLDSKSAEINRLSRENANLPVLRKKIKEYEQIKNDLIEEVAALKRNLDRSNRSKSEFSSELDQLRLENEKLISEIQFLKSINTNDFMVKGIKRSKKVTAFASRTKEISLSFDFPEEYIHDLIISVQAPDGKTFLSSDKEYLTIRTTNEVPATVYATGTIAKRMELLLKPEKKFSKGIYKFTVFKANDAVETILLQLK